MTGRASGSWPGHGRPCGCAVATWGWAAALPLPHHGVPRRQCRHRQARKRVPIPDIGLELGRAITSASDEAHALAGLGRCAAL